MNHQSQICLRSIGFQSWCSKYLCRCERSDESRFHYFREMFNWGVNICMCGKLISYVLVEDRLIYM